MKNFLVKTLIIAAAVVLASYVLPGVAVARFTTALMVALILSLLNYFVRPILILLTLPITILTLGLFLFVINAVIIMLAGKLVTGFRVSSVWWALLFSLLLSFFIYILEVIIEPDYRKK
jgi:putative membrane protein